MRTGIIALGLLVLAASPCRAEGFTQFIGFGSSNLDTGWFAHDTTGIPTVDSRIATAISLGGNASFNGPGPGNAGLLADWFGLSANPANTPGGTNYAIGGAFNSFGPGGSPFQNLFPNVALPGTVNQIHNYLASVGGNADSRALYVVSSGGNSVTAARNLYGNTPPATTYLAGEAQVLANAVADLRDAGARTIVVSNIYYSLSPDPIYRSLAAGLFNGTWASLDAAGVNFIPADLNSLIVSVAQNQAAYGFTAPLTSPACIPPLGFTAGYGAWCGPTTTPSLTTGYLASADATQTHLFFDNLHVSPAGQQIIADYYYNLIVGPSTVSMLPEAALLARTNETQNLLTQVASRMEQNAALDVWILGDGAQLAVENESRGFLSLDGETRTASVGISYRALSDLVVGLAATLGTEGLSFDLMGHADISERTAALFLAYERQCFGAQVIASYGLLDIDLNRRTPLGITAQDNIAHPGGTQAAFAVRASCDLVSGNLKHGPFGGLTAQSVEIDGFTEMGGVTSLSFNAQTRNSAIAHLGYQAKLRLGAWSPFASAQWNRELVDEERNIVASLTTVVAPSYSMLAVPIEKDWADATLGTEIAITEGLVGLVWAGSRIDPEGEPQYSGAIGLSYALR